MIEIQLEGSFTARYKERSMAKMKKSPICPLVRDLIADGTIKPEDPILVTRDGKEVFNILPASYWAEYDYIEDDRYGPRRKQFVEFEGFEK